MKLPMMADTSRFAHLMGIGRRKAEDQTTDPEKDKPDPEQAEGEDLEDEEAPPEDDPEKDPADDETGDDEEMAGEGASARARQRERSRCAAIFADPAAGKNPALAAHLAFGTTLNRKAALKSLRLGAQGGGLGQRLASAINPDLGPQGKAGGKPSAAATWDAAMKTARKG
ncbi:hypothetical protein [Zavarzinia sp.]|uniref:hypothetical protein n=1 Tax=Zavarzinia sp. TaxID=2027920 RepID=UPI003BB6B04C